MSLKTNFSRFAAVAVAAAAAFVAAGASASSIKFDPMGTSGASMYTSAIDSLDWLPDNALSIGALSSTTTGVAGQLAGERYFQTVAQGMLNSFHSTSFGNVSALPTPFGGLFGREFTFQTSFYEFGSALGTSVASFRLAPGASYFRIYADTTPDSNTTTGAGYGDGLLILEGTLTGVSGTFNTKTFESGAKEENQVALLDSFGTDQQSGVMSVIGQGSNKITIDVTYLDKTYFADDIAQLVLSMDYFDTTNLNAPFISENPSDQVVGVTPSYSLVGGTKINGMPCSAAAGGATESGDVSGRCDFHFQSDASSSFIAAQVPEPGSLALIGIALGGLGFAARRKRA